MDEKKTPAVITPAGVAAEYDAPRVESVLTADDLAREVQYAGAPSQFDDVAS